MHWIVWKKRAKVLSIIGVSVVALAGCGVAKASPSAQTPPSSSTSVHPSASVTDRSTPSPSPSSSASGILAPTATVSVTNPSNIPACLASNLSLSLVSRVIGAGTHIRVYALENRGQSVCTLVGYPSVDLLNAQGQLMTTTASHVTDQQNLVTLRSHGKAWFVLQYPDAQGFSPSACPASTKLEVVPPGSGSSLVIGGAGGRIRAFGGTRDAPSCGQLEIQPVTPPGARLSP